MLQRKQTATLKSLKPLHFHRKPISQGPLPRNITNFLLLNSSNLFQRIMSLNGTDKQALITEVLCHSPRDMKPQSTWSTIGSQLALRKERHVSVLPINVPLPSLSITARWASLPAGAPGQPEDALGKRQGLIQSFLTGL